MCRKTFTILIFILLIFTLGTQIGLTKEEQKPTADVAPIIEKLDKILANQVQILKQFEEIKQELAVIKVRASRR